LASIVLAHISVHESGECDKLGFCALTVRMEPPAAFDESMRHTKPGRVAVMCVGTSSGVPTNERNVSATLVRLPNLSCLVDAGEGTQHQFVKKNLPFTVDMVLITHLHG
jgi:hypothetical protein